jgi:hypothetical protein
MTSVGIDIGGLGVTTVVGGVVGKSMPLPSERVGVVVATASARTVAVARDGLSLPLMDATR